MPVMSGIFCQTSFTFLPYIGYYLSDIGHSFSDISHIARQRSLFFRHWSSFVRHRSLCQILVTLCQTEVDVCQTATTVCQTAVTCCRALVTLCQALVTLFQTLDIFHSFLLTPVTSFLRNRRGSCRYLQPALTMGKVGNKGMSAAFSSTRLSNSSLSPTCSRPEGCVRK